MGADWLQLFDKKRFDEIVCLNPETLASFVQAHLNRFGEFSKFQYGFDGVRVEERVQQLLDGGDTEGRLKEQLVDELCFTSPMLHLDYWGCYVEVFGGVDPPGAIADYALFPERQQQNFLLLLPNHIDLILESLDLHLVELTVMTDADIDLLRQWRNLCAADPSQMVAYIFDA